jgi:hypothetical protein
VRKTNRGGDRRLELFRICGRAGGGAGRGEKEKSQAWDRIIKRRKCREVCVAGILSRAHLVVASGGCSGDRKAGLNVNLRDNKKSERYARLISAGPNVRMVVVRYAFRLFWLGSRSRSREWEEEEEELRGGTEDSGLRVAQDVRGAAGGCQQVNRCAIGSQKGPGRASIGSRPLGRATTPAKALQGWAHSRILMSLAGKEGVEGPPGSLVAILNYRAPRSVRKEEERIRGAGAANPPRNRENLWRVLFYVPA